MPDVVAGYSNQIQSSLGTGKRTAAAICAILLGLIFLVSGGWKVLSPLRTGELLEQAQVPGGWGAIGAAALGTFELLAALMLFVPRFRKLGGLLGSALMLFFIGWVAVYYHVLVGQECNCFPIIKRTVGPGFFIGDAVMLLL
ncbi:MAG TPA: MauE/DoxX family redox-associated membrane protein, partial [Bryobacteraceae bacterium]